MDVIYADSFTTTKEYDVKDIGRDEITVAAGHDPNSELGVAVRVYCIPTISEKNVALYKLDEITIDYKLNGEYFTKKEKLGFVNDYFSDMPEGYELVKINVEYHKASLYEYFILLKECWWL